MKFAQKTYWIPFVALSVLSVQPLQADQKKNLRELSTSQLSALLIQTRTDLKSKQAAEEKACAAEVKDPKKRQAYIYPARMVLALIAGSLEFVSRPVAAIGTVIGLPEGPEAREVRRDIRKKGLQQAFGPLGVLEDSKACAQARSQSIDAQLSVNRAEHEQYVRSARATTVAQLQVSDSVTKPDAPAQAGSSIPKSGSKSVAGAH